MWRGRGAGADDEVEVVRDGSMPPSYDTWFGLHSKAKLTQAPREEPAGGLEKTLNR